MINMIYTCDEVAVDQIRYKVTSLRQGPADQGGGGGSEGELEEELGHEVVGDIDAKVVRPATESIPKLTPSQPEPHGPVGNGPQTHVEPVLDQDVDGVL